MVNRICRTGWLIALAAYLAGGSATAAHLARVAVPSRAAQDPSDWARVDTGRFSVALPPGWRYEALQGEDSFVGRFVGDGLTVHFDYGWFWNSLPRDTSAHELRQERVDERVASLYVPRDPRQVLALYIEHVDDMDRWWSPTHLSLVGLDVPLDRQALVLQVMRSVVFPRQLATGGRWEAVTPPPGADQLLDLDLDLMSGSGEGWLAGRRFRPGEDLIPSAALFRRTASGWEDHALDKPLAMNAVSGDWATELLAGQLYTYDRTAKHWRLERTAADRLSDVKVAGSPPTGWAVGRSGLLRIADGRSTESDGGWGTATGNSLDLLLRDPLPAEKRAGRASDAIAVGSTGAISRFDGQRWQAMAGSPGDFQALGVDQVGVDEAWIVGSAQGSGAMRHLRGDVVSTVPVEAAEALWSVDMLSPTEGWAVGGPQEGRSPGVILRYRDGTWEAQPPPCDCHLHAVQAMADGQAWAVGWRRDAEGRDHGILLHYVPEIPTVTPTAEGATGTATGTATVTATVTVTVAHPTSTPTVERKPSPTAGADGRTAYLPWLRR